MVPEILETSNNNQSKRGEIFENGGDTGKRNASSILALVEEVEERVGENVNKLSLGS